MNCKGQRRTVRNHVCDTDWTEWRNAGTQVQDKLSNKVTGV